MHGTFTLVHMTLAKLVKYTLEHIAHISQLYTLYNISVNVLGAAGPRPAPFKV